MGLLTQSIASIPWVGKAAQAGGPSERLLAPQFSYMLAGMTQWSRQMHIRAYGEVGWLFATVSRIAESMGSIQWRLYQVSDADEREEILDHPLLSLLANPNPTSRRQTKHEFFAMTSVFSDLTGEAPWWLGRNRVGEVVELVAMTPIAVDVVPSRQDFIAGYVYTAVGAERVPLERDEVIFHKLPNPANEYRGLGPVAAIMPELEAERYAVLWNRNFFLNSAEPNGIITVPGTLSPQQFDRLRSQWNETHRGVMNAHRIGILEGEAKYQATTMTARDMQFPLLRKVNRETILGAFSMPPSILGLTEGVNRANMDAALYHYGLHVLRPRLERLKAKMNTELVPLFGEGLELDYDDPTPGDEQLQSTLAVEGYRNNMLTLNEARERIGYDPDPTLGDLYQFQVVPSLFSGGGFGANGAEPTGSGASPELPIPETAKALAAGWGGMAEGAGTTGGALASGNPKGESADAAHWKAFDARLQERERGYTGLMVQFFQEQEAEVLAALAKRGIGKAVTKDFLDALFGMERWRELLARLGWHMSLGILENEARMAISKFRLGIAWDVRNPRVQRWLGERMRLFSHTVNQTTQESISDQLRQGEAKGEGIPQLQERVRSVFAEAKGPRATTIARTETISASNAGAMESYRQAGVQTKRWLATMDDRVRDTHAAANGQIVPMETPFNVGGELLDAPGQGNLAANNIQCRCTVIPIRGKGLIAEVRCPTCAKLVAKEHASGTAEYCPRCKTPFVADS